MNNRTPSRLLNNLRRALRQIVSWIGSHELSTLIGILLLAGGLWLFAEIAEEVFEGETQTIDRAVLLGLRNADDLSDPLGPRWLEEMGRDFTALGGVGLLLFLTLSVMGYLIFEKKWRAACFVLVAIVGALGMSFALKSLFDRPRPDLVPHGSFVYTTSFPSGHAMMSAATFLTLGALLARVHKSRGMKAYFLSLAIILTVAVGASRVYLGVHWPTDVLAGWTLGACWAILCWLIAQRLQRSGELEGETTTM